MKIRVGKNCENWENSGSGVARSGLDYSTHLSVPVSVIKFNILCRICQPACLLFFTLAPSCIIPIGKNMPHRIISYIWRFVKSPSSCCRLSGRPIPLYFYYIIKNLYCQIVVRGTPNSRSAEVPFLNIISYLIQFVKFRSICAFQRTREVHSNCVEGQSVLICATLEEISFKGWRSICGASQSDRRGQSRVSGFKVISCI